MLTRRNFLKMSLLPFLYGRRGRIIQSDIKGLVIGAGMAGVTVARSLHQAGVDITVLEARDRVGGRIWTDRSLGTPVDMGASWIHGTSGNPITDLAQGIDLYRTNYENVRVFTENGSAVGESALITLGGELEFFLEAAEELSEELDDDISLAAALRVFTEGESLTPLQQWGVVTGIEHDYAATLDQLSLFYSDSGEDFDGDDALFPGGYDQIINLLTANLNIQHNQVVRVIEYESDGVRVTTDTDVFEADGAVITLPLGVLQSGQVEFSPPLPDWKQNAINRLSMGRLNKIAMRFPSTFWQADADFIGYASETRGEFPIFMNVNRFADAPVLMSLVSGDFSKSLEDQTDDQIMSQIMSVLRRIYGTSIPDPEAFLISRWGKDPFAFGSYSHIPVGASPEDHEALAEPVGDTLFFAGEATNADYASTVHGAHLSGLREATRILDLL